MLSAVLGPHGAIFRKILDGELLQVFVIGGVLLVLNDRDFDSAIFVGEFASLGQSLFAVSSLVQTGASVKLSRELLDRLQLLVNLEASTWLLRLRFRDFPPIGENIRPCSNNVLHQLNRIIIFPLFDVHTLIDLRSQIRCPTFVHLLGNGDITLASPLLLLELLVVLFRILLHEVFSAILEGIQRMCSYLPKKSATGLIFLIKGHAILDLEANELIIHQNYLVTHILGRILHHK